MTTHWLLKQLQIALAMLSISGFLLRWGWRMAGSAMAHNRWVKTLPHVVDTLFLLTGILLALGVSQYLFSHAWLTAKIGGLVLYIVVGAVAMRTAPRAPVSIPAFAAAVLIFGWIVSVAWLRTPLGLLVYI